jgi:hypothetical protein
VVEHTFFKLDSAESAGQRALSAPGADRQAAFFIKYLLADDVTGLADTRMNSLLI